MDVKYGCFTFTFFKQFLPNTEIYIIRRKRTQSKLLAKQKCNTAGFLLRACLHGGGVPQVGEVARLGGVTRLSM